MKRKFVFSVVLLIVFATASLIYIYVKGTEPLKEKYEAALKRSREVVQLATIEHVDWFHFEEAYTIIEGFDKDGTGFIVLVPDREEEDIKIVKQSDGLSKADVLDLLQSGLPELAAESRPQEIVAIKYGMVEKNPVYEITYYDRLDRYSILYLDFYAGEWFKVFNL